MGRITPSFRVLYEEVMSDLRTEPQGAFVESWTQESIRFVAESMGFGAGCYGEFHFANSMR